MVTGQISGFQNGVGGNQPWFIMEISPRGTLGVNSEPWWSMMDRGVQGKVCYVDCSWDHGGP